MEQDFLIIDAHVHTYANAAIGRQALGKNGYGYSGTISELKEVMKNSGIIQAVMANFTPVQEMKAAAIKKLPSDLDAEEKNKALQEIDQKMIERMKRRNEWTCEMSKEDPSLSALISIDFLQNPEEMAEEIEYKVRNLGAKGIKMHPMGNAFNPCEKKLWPVYFKAQELGIPVLFHTGSHSARYESKYGRPNEFEDVAKSFPDLRIVLAHIGKGAYQESVEMARKYSNLFFDTSTCLYEAGISVAEAARNILATIKKIGVDRIMFGTDWPWYDPLKDIVIIKSMHLSWEEKAAILGLNAKNIFKL